MDLHPCGDHGDSNLSLNRHCAVTGSNGTQASSNGWPARLAPQTQKGFATFLLSVRPVFGSLNSFQLIGYIWFSASLFAITTPNSFVAVER